MTKVVFETAAFADAVKKANILCPTTGLAFDKAAGLVLDVDPSGSKGWKCLLRSTDLSLFRTEWVDPIEIEGDAQRWRLPSLTFARLIASLPIGTGKTVTLEQAPGEHFVKLTTTSHTRARFNLIDKTYYPTWELFDPYSLPEVQDMGGRIASVQWAAAKSGPPLDGIHFTGRMVCATNRYKIAIAPLTLDIDKPVTVPMSDLASLLKQTGDSRAGLDDDKQLLIMPDMATQLRCITYAEDFPDLTRVLDANYPERTELRKAELIEIVQRASGYAATDRDAALQIHIGREEIAVISTNQEVGIFGDGMDVTGFAVHPRVKIIFNPTYVLDALNNCPNERIELFYDPDKINRPLLVDGGSGYRSWIAPRAERKGTDE